ncbi:MAG TPA: hypothetical protein VEI96_02425 [Thermodesulfovibrionales bacterium]|nr:hypothetical protein [Thermodesulfovibrionales bacterium]
MESVKAVNKSLEMTTWAEESGLLDFLSRVYEEVARFERTFGFGVSVMPSPPINVDSSTDLLRNIGFVIVRHNRTVGRDYCLYSLLSGRALYGYIGLYSDGAIETLRELQPLTDFRNGTATLFAWLRDLVKTSCEKI